MESSVLMFMQLVMWHIGDLSFIVCCLFLVLPEFIYKKGNDHIFCYVRAMINEGKSNSILVSGESGAGKTETTKMLMRYLAYLGGRAATEGRTVEQQVLEVRL